MFTLSLPLKIKLQCKRNWAGRAADGTLTDNHPNWEKPEMQQRESGQKLSSLQFSSKEKEQKVPTQLPNPQKRRGALRVTEDQRKLAD